MIREMKVYNNLTRKKETFVPKVAGKVSFYSCGPTTYDFLHVGNARALVVGDLFNRVLSSIGYDVTFVRNFTDVDDKIIERAQEKGEDSTEYAAKFVDECLKDMNSLGMRPATHTPKATETMEEMISMISELEKKGHAYAVDGEVYFHVPSFESYGKLSKKDLESLEHGRRVEVDQRKKHPSDFVLWKPAKDGEPYWESPWGNGRPGWHIECSAMARKFLGQEIDLHHGGVDLMFPHHENEIAQSEACHGKQFCSHWAHNEFLNFGEEKMSKSLGNLVTIRSFIEAYSGQILRQILIGVHYRAKLEWSEDVVERAVGDVERIHNFVVELRKSARFDRPTRQDYVEAINEYEERFFGELCNDFNSAGALAVFFEMIRWVRRELIAKEELTKDLFVRVEAFIETSSSALGHVHQDPEAVLARLQDIRSQASGSDLSDDDIKALIQERVDAKASRNWGRADEIRDELKAKGIVLKDSPDGTTWSYE